jgi:hypothetical protein
MTPQEAAALYEWAIDGGTRKPPEDEATAKLVGRGLVALIEAAGDELTWVAVDDDGGPEQIVDLARWQS